MGNRQTKGNKGKSKQNKNNNNNSNTTPSNNNNNANHINSQQQLGLAAGNANCAGNYNDNNKSSRIIRRDTTEHVVEKLLKKGPLSDYYTIDKSDVLGKGHYATVYRGQDKKSGLQVAIKVIQISKSRVEALKREVEVLRKVGKHPNIVTLYDIFITDTELILVLELLLGGELFDRMVEKGPYSEREASHHIRKIGAALKFLHRAGIVHRDLKPENLILAHKGDNSELKIADFGLANIVDDTKNSVMKTVCGTWAYCAPEVKTSMTEEGGPAAYTAKVDMWSVGVILFVILAAYHPFDADGDASDAKLWKNICSGEFDFNDPAWDHISNSAKDLIRNLIVVDPKERYGAEELLNHPWIRQQASVPATPITPTINRSLTDYHDQRRKNRKSFGAKIKWMNPLAGNNNTNNNSQRELQNSHENSPSSPSNALATQSITEEDVIAQRTILSQQHYAEDQEKLKGLHIQEQQQLQAQQKQQLIVLQQQMHMEHSRIIEEYQQLHQQGEPVDEQSHQNKLVDLQMQVKNREQQLLSLFQQQQQQLLGRQEQQREELKTSFMVQENELKQQLLEKQQQKQQVRFAQCQPNQENETVRQASPSSTSNTFQNINDEDTGMTNEDEMMLPQLTLNTLLPPVLNMDLDR